MRLYVRLGPHDLLKSAFESFTVHFGLLGRFAETSRLLGARRSLFRSHGVAGSGGGAVAAAAGGVGGGVGCG